MTAPKQTVLVIGGTGAQGVAVVKALTSDSAYNVRILTRTATSSTAHELLSFPHVSFIEGSAHSEATLHTALTDVDIVYANTNGFAIGEKAEIYWGIRLYELAREHNVKHFVWGSLESAYQTSGYQARFRTGHFDGKSKVADWISTQASFPDTMIWSALTSCMYVDMLTELLAPFKETDANGEEVFVFKAPLGTGAMPLIVLDDLGKYARWIVDNPARSSGVNLKIATEHIRFQDLASTFTQVTGHKAIFRDITLDEYFSGPIWKDADKKVGHSADHEDETLQTYRQNFSGFWNTWKEDVIVRDMAPLDEILPGRVKSVGEWMKLTGYNGERKSVLKDYKDAAILSKK